MDGNIFRPHGKRKGDDYPFPSPDCPPSPEIVTDIPFGNNVGQHPPVTVETNSASSATSAVKHDATAQHIKACADAAIALGEPTCLTKVNGVLVRVHAPVPSKIFETPIRSKTVAMQMLIAKCGHRHSLRKGLHSKS